MEIQKSVMMNAKFAIICKNVFNVFLILFCNLKDVYLSAIQGIF